MRVLVDILHPAHVHFFRNFIFEMQSRGHDVRVLSRNKDVAVPLLESYGIDHTILSTQRPGRLRLAMELAQRIYKTQRAILDYKPDILMGAMGPSITLPGRASRVRTLVFYNNETTARLNAIVARIADAWISPRALKGSYGEKHIRYNGCHELAYLHPNRFTPDPDRLRRRGIDPEKPYSILRFVAWESIHDHGESGLDLEGKRKAIDILSRLGPVYITSEKTLPPEFEPYRLNLPVEDMHHALAFATLTAGESSTVASESACLGAHAVFISKTGRGVNEEQEERYGLVKNFTGGRQNDALRYLEALAGEDPDQIKDKAQRLRQEMLDDVIDVTAYMADLAEAG